MPRELHTRKIHFIGVTYEIQCRGFQLIGRSLSGKNPRIAIFHNKVERLRRINAPRTRDLELCNVLPGYRLMHHRHKVHLTVLTRLL